MNITGSELAIMLAIGIPIGGVLAGMLSDREKAMKGTTTWCLLAGTISLIFTLVALVTHLHLVPAKGIVGLVFIGLPALSAGLVLLSVSKIREYMRGQNSGSA